MVCNNLFLIPEIEKKILAQNIYSKFLIRFLDTKNKYGKRLSIVDNDSSCLDIQLNRGFLNRFLKCSSAGGSFFFTTFLFKKKRKNFQFKFQHILFHSRLASINFVHILFTKLQSLRSKKKFLILVRPCRGGMYCIFNGLNGIIPRKHLSLFFQILFQNRNQTKGANSNFNSFLNRLKFTQGRQLVPGFVFIFFLLKLKYSFYLKSHIRFCIFKQKKKKLIKKKGYEN